MEPLPPPGLLWRALLDGAFDAIVVSTLQGKVIQASHSFFELTGTEPEHVIGRDLAELGFVDEDVLRRRTTGWLGARTQLGSDHVSEADAAPPAARS